MNEAPQTDRRPRSWVVRHRHALGIGLALVAAGMTVLWTLVVPEKAQTTDGIQALAIRWGHPVTWALLTVLGALIAVDASRAVRSSLAWLSLVAYAAFVLGLML